VTRPLHKIGRRTALIGRRRLLALLIVVSTAGLPQAAGATANVDGAKAFIESLAKRAIGVLQRKDGTLEEREAEFRKILSQDFDLAFIGRFVLGRNWRKATPEQQAEYQALFAEWILKSYSRRLGGYSGETFQTVDARAIDKTDILVQTRINRPSGPPILADWRVRESDGTFQIIDIMVEGVSMAVTQRSEFNSVVTRDGIDGLLNVLRARTQKFEMTSQLQR
jgi:phospholipid transport system substrate-binding protein